MLMIEKREEELKWISCIQYHITFKNQTEALLDSKSVINVTSQAFTYLLGLKISIINIKAKKIDSIILKIYKIIVFTFFMLDKDSEENVLNKAFY